MACDLGPNVNALLVLNQVALISAVQRLPEVVGNGLRPTTLLIVQFDALLVTVKWHPCCGMPTVFMSQ